MHAQSEAEQDSSSTLTPPVHPGMPWRVAAVDALSDFRLHVRFVDGTEGVVDLMALVHSPDAGVFAALADRALFAEAHVEGGAVSWPGDIDLAPDAMYAEIRNGNGAPAPSRRPGDQGCQQLTMRSGRSSSGTGSG